MQASIVLGILALGLASPMQAPGHTKDTPEDVKKALADNKALLIDVREKAEWDDGHLKDAKHLPLSKLKSNPKAEELADVIPKSKIVYTHCAAGRRSLEAADLLKKHGYDVRPLKPGYKDLLKAGFDPASK